MGVVGFRGGLFLVVAAAVVGAGCQGEKPLPAESAVLRVRDPLADGVIIRVNKVEGDVYINLAKADRIQNGMRFVCFDPRKGVRLTGGERMQLDEKQSNGIIEVMEVGEKFARCRIVAVTGGRGVGAGDQVANLAYHASRNRKRHFVIDGEFDLNGDGVATADERERLMRMIIAWGGEVDAAIAPRTDYLILGKYPASASIGEKPVVPGGVVDERGNVQKEYEGTLAEARRLAIPVLNQNRALELLGYYSVAARE